MRNMTSVLILVLLMICQTNAAVHSNHDKTVVTSESPEALSLRYDLTGINQTEHNLDGQTYLEFSIEDESYTQQPGYPQLPAISRYVVIPPGKSVEMVVTDETRRTIRTVYPPVPLEDANQVRIPDPSFYEGAGLYPAEPVEMYGPIAVRHVRMVMVTAYPIQYDPVSGTCIERSDIEVELRFNDGEVINPVNTSFKRIPSYDFQTIMESMTLNPPPHRDQRELVEARGYHDYYLFVLPDNISNNLRGDVDALVYRMMEWKRRAGNKVDLLLIDNGRSPNQIEEGIQDYYDDLLDEGIEPFDHVLLIGEDETNPYSGNRGGQRFDIMLVGPTSQFATSPWVDHWDIRFAYLEGDDIFPDVSINRFHTGGLPTLACGVNKTLSYESEPYWEDTDWFMEAVVEEQAINGADDGMTRTVDYYVESLEHAGFEVVDEWRRNQDGGGDPADWLMHRINSRIGFIAGRAKNYNLNYVWGNQPQNTLEVVGVYPMAVLNSGHGEWAMESLFWVGREWYTNRDRYNSLAGAKGCVATTCTWSRPGTTMNNCLGVSTVHGVLDLHLSMGWARVYTCLNFWRSFPGENNYIKYTEDHGMCGDPGIRYWKGVPEQIEVDHPEELAVGDNYIPVQVFEEGEDEGLADMRVVLYSGDMDEVELFDIKYTDEEGFCEFVIDPEHEGSILITVLEEGIYPYKGFISIEGEGSSVRAELVSIDDEEGNGDGRINPGETLLLSFDVVNLSNRDDAEGVHGSIVSHNPYVEVEENRIDFGDIEPDGRVEGNEQVIVHVDHGCPDGESVVLLFELEWEGGSWSNAVPFDPIAPKLEVESIAGGGIIPVGMFDLEIELKNIGRMTVPPFTARMMSSGWKVNVVNGIAEYEEIRSGQSRVQRGNSFRISGNTMTIPGSVVPVGLVIETGGHAIDSVFFELQVSEPHEGAPMGPDGYGYTCYDDTDVEFENCPEYDWIEISGHDNGADLDGDLVRIDNGNNRNGWAVVRLPFDFQYYGEVFDEITICTNGFLTMGDDEDFVPNFQNWPLDGGGCGGGFGMIAPLWDDLNLSGGGNPSIWTAYDDEWGLFIVEWYNIIHNGANSQLKFQVILYDPEIWPNGTGDGDILFQYESVTNRLGTEPTYASVGITSPGNTTGISYTSTNQYPVAAAPLQDRRAIKFMTSPPNTVGRMLGQVVDAEDNRPIEGAVVYTGYGQAAITDEEGAWEIVNALALPSTITAYKQGYNDSTLVDTLLQDSTLTFNFGLLHPEFIPSVDDLSEMLQVDENTDLNFEILNEGNGPLTWSVERRLRGEAETDPWELRRSIYIGQAMQDDRIGGAVFIDDYFYVSGAGDDQCVIYVIDRDGNLVRTFDQFGEANYGMVDLAWDGELIWGTGERAVFGFTPEGELVKNWNGAYNPNTNITWDSIDSLIWVSGTVTNDIVGFNRDGEEQTRLSRMGFRTYGLAYYPDDPDGYNLYLIHSPSGGIQMVHKMNTATNDTIFVKQLQPENGGRPSSAYISNQVDYYSWVFIDISNAGRNNGGDRIDIWQIDARKDWFAIEPVSGIVNSDDVQEFTLTLDATDLPPVLFEGDLVFTHNALGGEDIIPVALEVSGDPNAAVARELELSAGWNMVSVNVEPVDDDIMVITEPLTAENLLVLMKDGDGNFYMPSQGFNGIPFWNYAEGYQMMLMEDCVLEVRGVPIEPERAIPLDEGWNMVAYYPRVAVEAMAALAGIEEQLIIAKDGGGLFYLVAFGYSNMGDLREGQGYLMKVSEDVDLVYTVGDQLAAVSSPEHRTPVHFSIPVNTGSNMSLLLLGSPDLAGCEIAALNSDGAIVGSGVIDEQGRCGMAVWGDNPSTSELEGLRASENFNLVLWNGLRNEPVEMELLIGSSTYESDGITAGRFSTVVMPMEFDLTGVFPNPFNATSRIEFSLPDNGEVQLIIYDLQGREVVRLVDSDKNAGYHKVVWDAANIPSGVYIARLVWAGETKNAKLTLVR